MYRYSFLLIFFAVSCAETPKSDPAEQHLPALRTYCAKAPKDLNRITDDAAKVKSTPLLFNLRRRAEAYKVLQLYRGVPPRFETLMTAPNRIEIKTYKDAKRFLYLYQSVGISEAGCSSARAGLLWRMLLLPLSKVDGWKDKPSRQRERGLALKKWKSYTQTILGGYVEASLLESIFRDLNTLENLQMVTLSPNLVKLRAQYFKGYGVGSPTFQATQKAFPSGDCTSVTPKSCNKKKFVIWAKKRQKYEINLLNYLTSIKTKISLEIAKL